ncbi:L-tyrosine/L-tryptophan isonitrile synthase family protein [Streptomyces sp. HNM0575]|uniref:L-tyrosine/L-tryptophan isonitrile synthase family protein n=1 Tax=Streptomyces sp. HNM0575 TaxID=2716338 RepID=UPI00145DDBF0|nr:isocyanide synthase family protein [Streptomyces sp. HNM0575]NLU72926.1 L-tyrosine/L-tryptophan isonitrile synthase family protein [Streptomyces sp. HNM0575]
MLASHALPLPASEAGRARERARVIARLLLRHQRRAGGAAHQPGECREFPCGACEETQARVIEPFVREGRPVRLLLPAFPGKSPNRAKVLGALPDLAEEVALEFLDLLAARIREVHPPGAEIVICSDGRVFSDAVRIPDEDITAYHDALRSMVAALPGRAVSVFTLDQATGFADLGHDEMRRVLTERHAVPLESLRARIRHGEDLPLYRAVTRFLFEDGNTPEYGGSRAALQRDARRRAYVVIQRSKAWGDFLAERFPGSVRLSIHPQPCSSAKLGIRLGESTGAWLTPWHGVAVDVGGRVVLMKRAEAERLGGELAVRDGRPSHYVLREPGLLADESAPVATVATTATTAPAAAATVATVAAVARGADGAAPHPGPPTAGAPALPGLPDTREEW